MNSIALNLTTVSFIFGILLFLVSLIIMVSPLRERLTVIQSIQGFGVNLQITVLTLLILISAGLLTSGIWLQLRAISGDLEALTKIKEESEKDAKKYKQLYEDATTRKATLLLSLDGVNTRNKPNKESLTCKYVTIGENEADATVSPTTIASDTVKISTQGLKEDTTITRIILTDKDNNRTWESKKDYFFQPFLQKVEMEKQREE